MAQVQVDIEYCTICGLRNKCEELKAFIEASNTPNLKVNCLPGPQGAYEISINNRLIYSKIKNKTFPEYDDIVQNVRNASENQPLIAVRPTKDECSIM